MNTTTLATTDGGAGSRGIIPGREGLVTLFLSGLSRNTVEAYGRDLETFAAWLGVASPGEAAERLLGLEGGEANAVAAEYRAHLLDRGLAPSTINRRLAALRSLVKLARTLGMVGWAIETPRVASAAYRDTRGCGVEGYRKALGVLGDSYADTRDRAILRLLFDLGLRRAEVAELDLDHYSAEDRMLSILGKGRRERETLTVPAPTAAALRAWIIRRGRTPGALFVRTSDYHGREGDRYSAMSGTAIYGIVRRVGDRAGVKLRPHGLRHAAITAALDTYGGDTRVVRKFSRHANINTVLIYDDNRTDMGGEIAASVADLA